MYFHFEKHLLKITMKANINVSMFLPCENNSWTEKLLHFFSRQEYKTTVITTWQDSSGIPMLDSEPDFWKTQDDDLARFLEQ